MSTIFPEEYTGSLKRAAIEQNKIEEVIRGKKEHLQKKRKIMRLCFISYEFLKDKSWLVHTLSPQGNA